MKNEIGAHEMMVNGGINFLVSIQRTDNFSMQGVVEWLDTGRKVHFRSALELMNLMEKASIETTGHNRMRNWNGEKQFKVI